MHWRFKGKLASKIAETQKTVQLNNINAAKKRIKLQCYEFNFLKYVPLL